MNITELIIFVSVVVIFTSMSGLIVFLSLRLRTTRKDLVQSEVEKFIFATQLDKMIQEQDTKNIEGSDGFLKFVSESRDWAFSYIEEVQQAITSFKSSVESDTGYEQAYAKLLTFLPDESQDKV